MAVPGLGFNIAVRATLCKILTQLLGDNVVSKV